VALQLPNDFRKGTLLGSFPGPRVFATFACKAACHHPLVNNGDGQTASNLSFDSVADRAG